MATFGFRTTEEQTGTLSLETDGAIKRVYFTELKSAAAQPRKVLLLEFNEIAAMTTIYPINTLSDSDRFLLPKYEPIVAIELVERHFLGGPSEFPNTVDEVRDYLAELPSGFVKDPNYGLGLDRRFKFIMDAVARVDGVSRLRITEERDLDVAVVDGGKTYKIGKRLFNAMLKSARKVENTAKTTVHKHKHQIGYANILTNLDRTAFPVRTIERTPDKLAEQIGDPSKLAGLSDADKGAVIAAAATSVPSTYKTQRAKLSKLHDEIELASLAELIARFEDQLAKPSTERQWQTLFEDNPFILDLIFGFPVVLVQGQAHVGGKRLDGGGEKIADFLFKNQLTNAAAVIEIKTPKMPLLNGTPYGSSVYGPSGKLTEAVVQALDQIERLHSDIHRIRSTHPQADLQTHGIRGVVVAGRLPPPDQMRSFELYRASLSGVSVITFDELLAKLKSLRDFLAPKVQASAATS